ncbi:MAG: hypothetical protein H6725_03920 [Sandaracinaceae bacterium]|nr:hypothetical protein [Sandaracinaceae bacterium]
MRAPASLALYTVSVAVSMLATLGASAQAQVQSEEEATRVRLAAAYAAQPTLSNGCSLAEAERRAGRVDEAAQRLDTLLEAARVAPPASDPTARATLSACRFNRARVHEDRGGLRAAYRLLALALDTDNVARLRIVEQRIVNVAARLVAASGCGALPSRFSAEALLRFADDAALRRCVTAARRAAPFCRAMAAADIPDTEGRYGVRRADENTTVLVEDRFLMVVTARGRRVTGLECELGADEERLSTARYHQVGRVRVLEVVTQARVSYACDDCEDGDDCRCADDGEVHYFLGARGELLLVLVPAWVDPQSMASFSPDSPELRDTVDLPTAVEGAQLLVNGRRLRLVRGALVPAP